jgi:hypothetical protein
VYKKHYNELGYVKRREWGYGDWRGLTFPLPSGRSELDLNLLYLVLPIWEHGSAPAGQPPHDELPPHDPWDCDYRYVYDLDSHYWCKGTKGSPAGSSPPANWDNQQYVKSLCEDDCYFLPTDKSNGDAGNSLPYSITGRNDGVFGSDDSASYLTATATAPYYAKTDEHSHETSAVGLGDHFSRLLYYFPNGSAFDVMLYVCNIDIVIMRRDNGDYVNKAYANSRVFSKFRQIAPVPSI